MKIWMSDTDTPTHRLVKLNGAEHSDFCYLGEFDDEKLKELLLKIQDDIDIEKNMKLINYYGYLNIFIIHKSK